MKGAFLTVCVLVLALSGCATLDHDDLVVLERHNISPALHDKMAHDEPLAVPDIIELSRKGLPGAFVIRYLRSTETSYPLTVDDVSSLKAAGVGPDVINYLLATPAMYGPPRYPYYYYTPPNPYGPYGYGYPYDSYHWHHW